MSDSLRPHGLQHTRPPCHHQLPEFTQMHLQGRQGSRGCIPGSPGESGLAPTPWYKRVVHTPVSPGRGRRTHQKKGEGKRFMRVYVESRSHEPPNLRAASASIVMGGGGGEKSIGVRETQESVPRSPGRDGRALSARRSVVLGRSLPVLRVCGVLSRPSCRIQPQLSFLQSTSSARPCKRLVRSQHISFREKWPLTQGPSEKAD